MYTKHAHDRMQQRGYPGLIDELLDRYGAETYDHHGGLIRYFNKLRIPRDGGHDSTLMADSVPS